MPSQSPSPGAFRPSDLGQMMESHSTSSGQAGQQSQAVKQAMSSANPLANANQNAPQPQQPPREMGTVMEEAQRAVTDVAEGVVNVPLDIIRDVLGLHRPPKTPEEQAKVQEFHQNWMQLDAEQQQAAQMRIQQEMQRKQMMEQEEEMKKQQEAQAKEQNSLSMPTGKVSGQAALDKMQQDRKGMGGASG